MNVTVKLALSDADRRAVRASLNRGGLATRSEVRTFIDRLYRTALSQAPEPKRRARMASEALIVTPIQSQTDWKAAHEAPPDAICAWCGRAKRDHGQMGFTCLPSVDKPGGRTFKPASTPKTRAEALQSLVNMSQGMGLYDPDPVDEEMSHVSADDTGD